MAARFSRTLILSAYAHSYSMRLPASTAGASPTGQDYHTAPFRSSQSHTAR